MSTQGLKRTGILAMTLLLSGGLSAVVQGAWWWPPQWCMVEPQYPTTTDEVVITIGGEWRDACVPDISWIQIVGATIYIDACHIEPPGICAMVITPWWLSETVGPLEPGPYTVVVSYCGMWPADMCSFSVEPGQPGCWDNGQCGPEEYCAKELGDCWGIGTCEPRPDVCSTLYDPVCGCDGWTWSNDCYAAMCGVNVAYAGPCDHDHPILQSAALRKDHGQNPLDVALAIDPPIAAAIESRKVAPIEMVLTFSEDVFAADGVPDESEVTLLCCDTPCGQVAAVAIAGDQITVGICDVPDQTQLTVILNGIVDRAGNPLVGDDSIHVRLLAGDVNGDGVTNLADMAMIKLMNGRDPAEPGLARFDVNLDGRINLADMAMAKLLNGNTTTCP